MNAHPNTFAVSKHATKRCRKRLGVPKKAVPRLAEKALDIGQHRADFVGSFRRYLDKVYMKKGQHANNMRVYNSHLFLFAGYILITAWRVPSKYQKTIMRVR